MTKVEKGIGIAVMAMIVIIMLTAIFATVCSEKTREQNGNILGVNSFGEYLIETNDGHIWAVNEKLNTEKRNVHVTFDTKHTKNVVDDEIIYIK